MNFIEFLESNGKINHNQSREVFQLFQTNHEKIGQILLKKKILNKNELLEQLQVFIENNQ
jgi:hypothetical protein